MPDFNAYNISPRLLDPARIPTVPLSYEDACTFLDKAIADKGEDYVYEPPIKHNFGNTESCRYFDQEAQPSCIVGHVLSHMGVGPFPFDSVINSRGVSQLVAGVSDFGGPIELEDIPLPLYANQINASPTYLLLARAQSYQDQGCPWGLAVQFAKDGSNGHYKVRKPDGTEVWE